MEGLGEGHFVVVGTGALPFSQIYWWITVNNLEGSEERHSVSLSNSVDTTSTSNFQLVSSASNPRCSSQKLMIHSSMTSPLHCSKPMAEAAAAVLFPQIGASTPQKHSIEGVHSYLTLLALNTARSCKGATIFTNKRLLLTRPHRPTNTRVICAES